MGPFFFKLPYYHTVVFSREHIPGRWLSLTGVILHFQREGTCVQGYALFHKMYHRSLDFLEVFFVTSETVTPPGRGGWFFTDIRHSSWVNELPKVVLPIKLQDPGTTTAFCSWSGKYNPNSNVDIVHEINSINCRIWVASTSFWAIYNWNRF